MFLRVQNELLNLRYIRKVYLDGKCIRVNHVKGGQVRTKEIATFENPQQASRYFDELFERLPTCDLPER